MWLNPSSSARAERFLGQCYIDEPMFLPFDHGSLSENVASWSSPDLFRQHLPSPPTFSPRQNRTLLLRIKRRHTLSKTTLLMYRGERWKAGIFVRRKGRLLYAKLGSDKGRPEKANDGKEIGLQAHPRLSQRTVGTRLVPFSDLRCIAAVQLSHHGNLNRCPSASTSNNFAVGFIGELREDVHARTTFFLLTYQI